MMTFFYFAVILLFAYGILINYYDRSWGSIPDFKIDDFKGWQPRIVITVIIPARNEETKISQCLHSILAQNYPQQLLEIIVVDDHSTDNTVSIVSGFKQPSIRLIHLKDHLNNASINSYKKKAIEVAIAHARGELIVTTDADCTAGVNWLRSIAAFQEQHDAVLIVSPVKIAIQKGLLSIFQSLDFLTLQGITGAAVFGKKHSMCNGANLAYLKTAFAAVNGFKGIDKIASGDDMLLMHKIVKKYPQKYFFLKSEEAIVTTGPETTWRAFLQQRMRWASKADQYDDKRIFWVLLIVYLLNLFIAYFFIAGFWDYKNWLLFLLLVVSKIIFEFSFVSKVAVFFQQQQLLTWFSLLQPLHIVYTIVVGFLGKVIPFQWKGRKVK